MKKLIALILVLMLAVIAFGCAAPADSDAPSDTATTPSTDKDTADDTDAEGDASAEEIPYIVGCVFPYTNMATTAELLEMGIFGYLEYWEQNGTWAEGKENIKIIPEFADNEGTSEGAISAAERLAPNVDAFIAGYGSGTTSAMVPVVERNKKPMLISLAVTESVCANPVDYIFRPTAGNSDCYVLFSQTLWPTLSDRLGGIKTFAMVRGSGEWCVGAAELHGLILEDMGAECVLTEVLQDGQTTDCSGVVRKIMDAKPDVVLSMVYINEAVQFQNSMRELGCTIPVYTGGAGYLDNGFNTSIPKGGADGVVSQGTFVPDVCNYSSDPEGAWEWFDWMTEFGGMEPNESTAATWLCMGVLIDALNRADSTSADDVAKALSETKMPTEHPANWYTNYTGGVEFDDVEGLVEGVDLRYNQNKYASAIIIQRFDDEWKLVMAGKNVFDALDFPRQSFAE